MSDPRFIREGFAANLAHMIEEMGEALAAAGKTARWGHDGYNPLVPEDERETNWQWLSREMIDVFDAWERLKKAQSALTKSAEKETSNAD